MADELVLPVAAPADQRRTAARGSTTHAPAHLGRGPTNVVAWLTAGKAARSGALWGAIFAVYVATQILAYASTYKTAAERAQVAGTLASSSAINALIGQGHELGTLAGYTEWKCAGILGVVGAIWGLLIGTKLLRGEEAAGRWELLLAGQTTPGRAIAQGVIGLGAGLGALWALTGATTVVVGRSSSVQLSATSSLFFALAVVSGGAMFLAVGALASQLAATRRQAAAYAAAALGICFALRTVADSGTSLAWLEWASPLGWVERLRPLTGPDPLALLPIVGLTLVATGLSVRLASARDLGAGTVRARTSTSSHTRLLSGPLGLTARLIRPTVLGWWGGIVAMALLLGSDTTQAVKAIQGAGSSRRVYVRLGGSVDAAKAYFGVSFLILALLIALAAAGQITAARQEEADGHLQHLFTRPVARWTWLGGRLLLDLAALVAGALLASLFVWAGATSAHSGVALPSLLGAGLNLVPPALCVLGIGVLTIGIRPRATSLVTYGVVAWSFLVELLGGIGNPNHWLLDTSLFHQMAAAPAVPVNWTVNAALLALGVVTAALGGVAFKRRDLAGE